MANEITACYVHWKKTYVTREFIILWSDHTWETICCPTDPYRIGDKSLKQFMELNKIAYKKMNREEAMNYINKKFKEIESLS
jgi:hypothetical protein|nr:MAG TPA: hypothetical protein [Caudoviricetes sp.]